MQRVSDLELTKRLVAEVQSNPEKLNSIPDILKLAEVRPDFFNNDLLVSAQSSCRDIYFLSCCFVIISSFCLCVRILFSVLMPSLE